MRTRGTKGLVIVAALSAFLWIAGSVTAQRSVDGPPTRGEASIASAVSPLLQYQGRLTDPSTGGIVANGTYTMTFSLYGAASGGSRLWTETNGVAVQDGLFSTALGDTAALDTGIFDGQALWLGIAVGGDAEATPRQQILPVAYALSLVPGATISDNSSEPVLNVVQDGSGAGGYFTSTTTYGVEGRTGSTSVGQAGVLGVAGGWASHELPYVAGVLGKSAERFGVAGLSDDFIGTMGRSDTYYGLWGESHGSYAGVWGASWGGGYGVRAYSTDSHGVYGEGDSGSGNYGGYFSGWGGVYGTGYKGVHGESSNDNGEGVQGHGTGSLTEGVIGTSDQATGVYGYSSASSGSNAIGVWGQTNATWGFYTGQNMYVGGTCTGCTVAFIAQSEDDGSLEIGDVVSVSGIGPPLMDQQTPILKVQQAAESDGGLLGVVQARAVVNVGKKLVSSQDTSKMEATEIASVAPGRVAPGDHLFVVVQGLVQVRADVSAGAIQVGDAVGPAGTIGLAQKLSQSTAPDLVLGRALEALDEGPGLIWVLILGR